MRWTLLFFLLALGRAQADSPLKIGMTRTQVEKQAYLDGGISVPFRMERYVLKSGGSGPKVTKVRLKFKPEKMTKEVYFLGKWVIPQQQPDDVLMEISTPYLELPFYD
jgi:hypothetical protein